MAPSSVPGFRQLIGQARVRDTVLLNERAMTRMVVQVEWILRRVGGEGIRLTKAGHLPPVDVVAATMELDWGWPISVAREERIRPLQELRTHMRDVGLLRVSKGVLRSTVKGQKLLGSHRGLWMHLAGTIHHSRIPAVTDATRLLLLFVATRSLDRRSEYVAAIAQGLAAIGWSETDRSALTEETADGLISQKWRLLTRLGVFESDELRLGDWSAVSVGGAAFARAALQLEAPSAG